jgi:hypothetical protein
MRGLMIPVNGRRQLGDIFDTFDSILSKGTDLYNANASILDPLRNSAIKSLTQSATPSQPAPTQNTQVSTPQPSASMPMSTGMKVALGVGGAVVLGAAGYLAFAGNGKKKAA